KKYNIGVRFLFGYDNFLVCDKEDEFQLNVRTIVPKNILNNIKILIYFRQWIYLKKLQYLN
ncbi:hypothetical protein OLR75_00020, partial [Campylobacter jejuni]|nr:hypothetical protein [Campylobacter jejuni]